IFTFSQTLKTNEYLTTNKMTTKALKHLVLSIFSFLLCITISIAQGNKTDPESRLKELGIQLTLPDAPTANFVLAVRTGNLVFLSGHGPMQANGEWVKGKVGSELTIEQGADAAKLTGISLL